jgi:ArsR family transcriptional regulator
VVLDVRWPVQDNEENRSYNLKRARFSPALRKRISFSFRSTAFSERITRFDPKARRKKRRRDARKRIMSALGLRGSAWQREMTAFQRSDGISPPYALDNSEMAAGDISRKMNIPKANVSQHLALMRNAGILETRREGVNIYYRISSPKVIRACELMREVLLENHGRRERVLRTARR